MSTTQDGYRADTDLRARIQAFTPDEPGAVFPFSARLAAENGWTREYALRVTREYLRFVYLAMTAGHPVTPSLAVDEAWHLHLTYTRSYWEEMCGRELGRPLHHEPTRGGAAEEAKFAGWYACTLASYRAAFGEEPPTAIWPRPRTEAASPPPVPPPGAPKRRGSALFAGALLTAMLTGACMGRLEGVDVFIGTLILVVGLFTVYTVQEIGRNPRQPQARRSDGGSACSDGGGGGGVYDGHGGSHHDGGSGHCGHSGDSGHGGCGHGGCGSGCGSGCGGGGE